MREITRIVLAQKAERDAEITQRPLGRRDRERQARAAGAAARAAVRRQQREERVEIARLQELLAPKPVPEPPLSNAERIEVLRAAVDAKNGGDARPTPVLLQEAEVAVKAKRAPRER